MSKSATNGRPSSAFTEAGMAATLNELGAEIRELYVSDTVPWVLGYSGGKDSTATLQLVWHALAELPQEQRVKPVFVISTDTLVENPIVAAWVSKSLQQMEKVASETGMPFQPRRLTPDVANTFWVNLIGKGYPAPRPKFRWCTDRLKIKPSNTFISDVIREQGEAILVLGIRKHESVARARSMERHERGRVRDRLSPNANLPNSLVYSPVEDWTNDDVWTYLMQVANPWGYRNRDLLTLYQGASSDGECPLVVDETTPSCGSSRFGCWVCTMVEQDKSMQAMIQNDQEKEWMLPLLTLRNELDIKDDRPLRDFRRMNGSVQLFNGRTVPGPYTQKSRRHWLKRVLEVQQWLRHNGPEEVKDIELITRGELNEIRRIWVVDKHEIEDVLPQVFLEATGEAFPEPALDEGECFSAADLSLLQDACGGDLIRYETIRDLLSTERRHRTMSRRHGLFPALERTLLKGLHEDGEQALAYKLTLQDEVNAVTGESDQSPPRFDLSLQLIAENEAT
jgi:DNA sulfur modification protein DndC